MRITKTSKSCMSNGLLLLVRELKSMNVALKNSLYILLSPLFPSHPLSPRRVLLPSLMNTLLELCQPPRSQIPRRLPPSAACWISASRPGAMRKLPGDRDGSGALGQPVGCILGILAWLILKLTCGWTWQTFQAQSVSSHEMCPRHDATPHSSWAQPFQFSSQIPMLQVIPNASEPPSSSDISLFSNKLFSNGSTLRSAFCRPSRISSLPRRAASTEGALWKTSCPSMISFAIGPVKFGARKVQRCW